MDQKLPLRGSIGCGRSYLDFVLCCSKTITQQAILHDAVGAVSSHTGSGAGWRYKNKGGPNSCLLGHVTGLVFCLYVKLFLPSTFESVII